MPPTGSPELPALAAVAGLDESEFSTLVSEHPERLGSLSIGRPNNGRLLNGIRLKGSSLYEVVAPDFAYGTKETVGYLEAAAASVHAQFPDTLPLHLGHISDPDGGYLSPHKSHQSGRDVDVGYYYQTKRSWYRRGTKETLDVPRTWSFVRALVTETDVEMILIDYSIQALLKEHAQKIGEDPVWLRQVFRGDEKRPRIIRHVRGHATHIHVRFYNPVAQLVAERAYPHLLDTKQVAPVVVYRSHKAKKGDTLGRLARKYGTTVPEIQRANGLRGTTIQARRVYKIPGSGGPPPVPAELKFPARRVPSAPRPKSASKSP